MMLKHEEVASYLVGAGLLDPASVVGGNLLVLNASRRNSNFKIIDEGGPAYLLKQSVGAERALTVKNEAYAYSLLRARSARLGRYLPGFHRYVESEGILLLEMLRGARGFDEHVFHARRLSARLAAQSGAALALLHRLAPNGPDDREWSGLRSAPPPWVLSLHRPHIEMYRQVSNANLQLIVRLQSFPHYCALLDALRGEWRRTSLVHYDIKLANLLAVPIGPQNRKLYSLKIIDWELAGIGDPLWDVGSFLGEIVGLWLVSLPITPGEAPHQFIPMARVPLERLQPALRSFWAAYEQRAGLDPGESLAFLLGAVRYAGARLIQTAFERCQTLIQPTAHDLYFMQIAFNILEQPLQAVTQLLGIAPRTGTTPPWTTRPTT